MNNCFDELKYRNSKIVCSGWCVPQTPGEPLKISVKGEDGAPVEVRTAMVSRADVGFAMFKDYKMDMYGYELEIPYLPQKKQTIRFQVDNGARESLEVEISPRALYWQHIKRTSLPGKMKRYLKAEDKKNFWVQDRFIEYDKKDREYGIWKEMTRPGKKELMAQRNKTFVENSLISIVVPVYRPKVEHLQQMVKSVLAQTYTNWELCLAYAGARTDETGKYLAQLEAANSKIKVKYLNENYGIAGNTNRAIELAAGGWIAFADQDDLLREDALYEYARAIHMTGADVYYCDEDKLDDETGVYFEPHFKPDFNPDLLCCNNYVCHMLMVRSILLRKVGVLNTGMDGAQDHDFVLRLSEHTSKIYHISKVLYSWRCHRESTALDPESKGYAYQAGKTAIENYYQRRGIPGTVEPMKLRGWYRTTFTLKEKPLVSILIPNKDHRMDLGRCIASLQKKSSYSNFEIIIIENNSEEEETFAFYEELKNQDPRIRVVNWQGTFNYAAINNFGASFAKGEYLLLLNNDTEIITEDAIESMLGYCMRPEVGVVGAKLFYEDNTIQHAGVLVGVSEAADHVFLHYGKEDPGYMGRAVVSQNMSAVTAACLMVKKADYEAVGGMEEEFTVAYNDVDFCLKIRDAGKLVVYDAFAEWYHYESKSRGYEETQEQKERFSREKQLLRKRWPKQMLGDPYYNKNLSLNHGYYSI